MDIHRLGPSWLIALALGLGLTLTLLFSLAGARQPQVQGGPQTGLAVVELRIGSQTLKAELADSESTRQLGLMYRESLPKDHGMLFVWPEPARYAMWMHNTPLPLSVAFIDADGRIVNIARMEPHTTKIHEASEDVIYALEMKQGWFQRRGIGAGDRVSGLPR
ncbi:MAG: DUF192 domain-containing protein [Thioalkalivibrio sp.]